MRLPQEWKVVATATLGSALGPGAILVFGAGVFVVPLQQEFGWTRAQVSVGLSIVHFAILFLSVAQGYLIDRWGTRRLALPSIPAFAAGLAAFGFLPDSLAVYYALCAIVPALALGIWQPAYLRAIGGWFDRRLGLAIGFANAGIGLGGAIVPLACGFLIATAGWRAAYWAMAATVLLVSFPMGWLFLRDAPAARRPEKPAEPAGSFAALLRARDFQWLVAAFLLFGLFNGAIIAHQVPMLIDSGWTARRAALAQGLFGASHITGRLLAGWLLDRIHPPRIMIAFLGLGIAGCAIDALDPASGIAFLASITFGLLVGAELDVLAVMVRRRFGMASFGRAYGSVFALVQIGAIVSVSLLGEIRQATGSYAIGMWALAAVLALVAAAFTRFRKPA